MTGQKRGRAWGPRRLLQTTMRPRDRKTQATQRQELRRTTIVRHTRTHTASTSLAVYRPPEGKGEAAHKSHAPDYDQCTWGEPLEPRLRLRSDRDEASSAGLFLSLL